MKKTVIARCLLAMGTVLVAGSSVGCAATESESPAVSMDSQSLELSFTRSEIEHALLDARGAGPAGSTTLVSDRVRDTSGLGITYVELKATEADLSRALHHFEGASADGVITFRVPIESLTDATVTGGFSKNAGDLCIYGKQGASIQS